MAKVIQFPGVTKGGVPMETVLTEAIGPVKEGFVVGWDKEDQLYIASSMSDGAEILWLLEKAKQRLMEVTDG